MHESASPRISISTTNPAGRAFAALLLANICLAFGPWFVRLADVGPISSAFWRLTLALPFLVAMLRLRGETVPRIGAALWLMLALSGLLFAADLASWHLGIVRTKLANATLFGNSTSLMFPIYGFLVARAWPNRWQVTALLLAALGGALLMGRSYELSRENLLGDLLCLLAGLFYTLYFIAIARARIAMGTLPALLLSTIAGVAPLLVFALLVGETVWPHNWVPLVALAIVSQVMGQGLMIYALGHFQPVVIGLALLVQPAVTAAIGWLAYDERLGLLDLVGGVAVAAALVLVRRPDKVPAA